MIPFVRAQFNGSLGVFAMHVLVAASVLGADPPRGLQPAPRSPATKTLASEKQTTGGYEQVLAAARKVDAARKAYAADEDKLAVLLATLEGLTTAEIQYLSATTGSRGDTVMREYLTRRGEVAARERGLAELTQLLHQVPESQQQLVRDEITLRTEELKQNRQDFARAERAWKTTERAQQFRYLNRRATFAR